MKLYSDIIPMECMSLYTLSRRKCRNVFQKLFVIECICYLFLHRNSQLEFRYIAQSIGHRHPVSAYSEGGVVVVVG